jgi:4-diphosphocytidyl-2-C-methyl-D-erythritol kinase
VLAREAGGYHQVETLFCRTALHDELTFDAAPHGLTLTVDGEEPGDPGDNLVTRAAHAFARSTGIDPAVHITLHKRIPAGAGLGGGSSDAATTLHALNARHGEPLSRDELLEIGRQIGSDVPFFVTGADLALGWGRGERLLTLPPLECAHLLIAVPDQPIATASAYAALAARRTADAGHAARSIETDTLTSWNRIARLASNDFEEIAIGRIPAIARVRDCLRSHNARITLLCGSGSAMFGLFDRDDARDAAAHALFAECPGMRTIRTSCGVDPLLSRA